MDEAKYKRIVLFLLEALESEHYGMYEEYADMLKEKFGVNVHEWRGESYVD